MTKFLDKISIGIDTQNDLMLDIKDNSIDVGLANEDFYFVHGSFNTKLPDMQIPISKFINFKKAVSTYDGSIVLKLEKNVLYLKGKNIKSIPLCKWNDYSTRIIKKIRSITDGFTPVSLKKSEYVILTQDKEMFDRTPTEIFFTQSDKKLVIEVKDETGFGSETSIKDVDLLDGKYIMPTIVFDILKKTDNLDIGFIMEGEIPLMYLRDTANNYVVEYIVVGMVE